MAGEQPTQVTVIVNLAAADINPVRVYGNIKAFFDEGTEIVLFDHVQSNPVPVWVGEIIPLATKTVNVPLTAKTFKITADLADAYNSYAIANGAVMYNVSPPGSTNTKPISAEHGHVNVTITWG